jgi:hypothetical protein
MSNSFIKVFLGVWGAVAMAASGAVLTIEEFDAGANGWGDRDPGEMTVSHDAGNEWMVGSFGPTFLPQIDAFVINSGTDFLGDYVTPGLTQIAFDLFAVNVLPSDLFIKIIDGANVFSYQITPINAMSWETYTVNLLWSAGWIGLNEAAFNSALTSVDSIEIQLTRNGVGSQSYYLDNIQTLDTELGDPGAPGSIPEPNTLHQVLLFALFVLYFRKTSTLRALT